MHPGKHFKMLEYEFIKKKGISNVQGQNRISMSDKTTGRGAIEKLCFKTFYV